jgi:hypothetical protein
MNHTVASRGPFSTWFKHLSAPLTYGHQPYSKAGSLLLSRQLGSQVHTEVRLHIPYCIDSLSAAPNGGQSNARGALGK